MSSAAAANRGSIDVHRIGHNRLTHTAIRKTVESVTAQAFHVDAGDVSATVEDDAGKLGVSVSVKLTLPPLLKPVPLLKPQPGREPQPTPATVFEQARAVRKGIVARGTAMTGLDIGRVDIRLTGGKSGQPKERRVE
ncbi:hypothetical protein OCL88_02605 [Paenarthrobacter sp. PAE-2]|uniref:hypothetical protein n=1 Tax=Paenarthrobacter sp. PAE-2 TaxID=2982532 RepID=UPI0022303032|nr:hypothetical protein [Paenarthrobacter sp. PAE-2]MCW3765354.1 hypothetical protein [Paenarthrobacter sp. PAE-2]